MRYGCKIESLGAKLPEAKVSSEELERGLKAGRPVKLELLTGIKSRRFCEANENALTLATDAINDCLRFSRIAAKDVEMIVCCSISKYLEDMTHHYEPALSLMIKKQMGNRIALNFDVSNACAGMATGMHLGKNFIERGTVKNCLLVSGEFISSISRNAQERVDSCKHKEFASLTVGDAGVALMLTQTDCQDHERIQISEFTTLSKYSDLCLGYQSASMPGAWMQTNMKKMHAVSIKNAIRFIQNLLSENGMDISDIDYLIPHQTSQNAMSSGLKRLKDMLNAAPGHVVVHIADVGNTASTTHLLALYSYLKEGRLEPGNKIMLMFFASGLIIGSIVFSVHEIIQRYGNGD